MGKWIKGNQQTQLPQQLLPLPAMLNALSYTYMLDKHYNATGHSLDWDLIDSRLVLFAMLTKMHMSK